MKIASGCAVLVLTTDYGIGREDIQRLVTDWDVFMLTVTGLYIFPVITLGQISIEPPSY
jgi:hypothetical protein